MEKELNIAEILKDKPQGTKLYDLLRNIDVELDKVHITDVGTYIECTSTNEVGSTLMFNYSELGTETCWLEGLQILLPSKEMRDWSKFAWKKGDVLVGKDNVHVIFEKFENDDYTRFKGKYYLWEEYAKEDNSEDVPRMPTSSFEKANDYEAQSYINTIEERLGGKLNLETLEIEKQPEFKDGDILCIIDRIKSCKYLLIYKNQEGNCIYCYATMLEGNLVIMAEGGFLFDNGYFSKRYATEEEKQQLFEALAKKNKAWDAEKKEVVDLKPKWTPKPFDKIVAFEEMSKEWVCDMFSHYSKNYEDKEVIVTLGGCTYFKALPFNEETAKLIGTTDNWEGNNN